MLRVDSESLNAVLDDGFVGLLDIRGIDEPATMTVDVISSKDNQSCVALSHVWADGLGNPDANSLPRCQLSYVGNMVKKLGKACGKPNLLLWLDTMCCPVASLEHQRQCLVLMRHIYERADHVLILDAQLNRFASTELDFVEICARLMFSAWTKRLWTLQEGALAKKLWVQLKDGPVDLDVVQADLTHIFRTQFIRFEFTLNLVGSLKRLRELVSYGPGRETRDITEIAKAVENRSVTVASDEPLCLCTGRDLDQSTVVNVDGSERMEAFWMALALANHVIPKNIIFFTGPRLPSIGARWAPASLLGSNYFYSFDRPKSTDQVASINAEGLSANFPAFEYSAIHSLSSIEESQVTAALQEFRFVRFARLSEGKWIIMFPESRIKVLENERPIIILEMSFDDIKNTIYGHNSIQGVVCAADETGNSGANIRPLISIDIVRIDPGRASILEAVLHHGRDLDLTTWPLSDHRASGRQSRIPTGHCIENLPTDISTKLLGVALVAFEEDLTLLPKLTTLGKKQSGELFDYALDTFAEYMIYYLGGRFDEVTRVWPKDQIWCLR